MLKITNIVWKICDGNFSECEKYHEHHCQQYKRGNLLWRNLKLRMNKCMWKNCHNSYKIMAFDVHKNTGIIVAIVITTTTTTIIFHLYVFQEFYLNILKATITDFNLTCWLRSLCQEEVHFHVILAFDKVNSFLRLVISVCSLPALNLMGQIK